MLTGEIHEDNLQDRMILFACVPPGSFEVCSRVSSLFLAKLFERPSKDAVEKAVNMLSNPQGDLLLNSDHKVKP